MQNKIGAKRCTSSFKLKWWISKRIKKHLSRLLRLQRKWSEARRNVKRLQRCLMKSSIKCLQSNQEQKRKRNNGTAELRLAFQNRKNLDQKRQKFWLKWPMGKTKMKNHSNFRRPRQNLWKTFSNKMLREQSGWTKRKLQLKWFLTKCATTPTATCTKFKMRFLFLTERLNLYLNVWNKLKLI